MLLSETLSTPTRVRGEVMSGTHRCPCEASRPEACTYVERRPPLMTFTAPRSTQKARPPTIGFLRGAPHDVLTSSGTSDFPADRRLLDLQPLPRASSRLQRPTRGRPTMCKHLLDGSHGVSSRSTYQGASSRRSAHAASGSRPEVPSPPSVSHAFRGFLLDVRAALFHAADVLRVLPFEALLLRPNVATLVVW